VSEVNSDNLKIIPYLFCWANLEFEVGKKEFAVLKWFFLSELELLNWLTQISAEYLDLGVIYFNYFKFFI
jgi:hypothetical protein